MGAGNSTATEEHNCSGHGYATNLTNATELPLTEQEIAHNNWIAEYGWIVAVSMALGGCVINNLGSNIQKLAFRFGSGDNRNPKCISVWASGFILQIVGATLDMVALGYGDQSLIAPIAALALVANIGFARCIHQEDLSCLDAVFMVVIFAGCVVCTISAGKHSCPITRVDIWNRFISFEYFWGYAIAITLIMTVLGAIQAVAEKFEKNYGPESEQYKRLHKVHRVGYPIMAGVIGAQGVLIGNAGVTCITEAYDGVGGPWQGWEIFLFIFFTVVCLSFVFLQIAFLNKGLERWDAMLEVPIMQSIWIVFCIIGGGVFFEEFKSFDLWQFFVFPLGVMITLSGVALLAYFRRKKEAKRKVVPEGVATGSDLGAGADDVERGKTEPLIDGNSKEKPPPSKSTTEGSNGGEETEMVDVVGTPVAPAVPRGDDVVEGDRVASTADISSAQSETKSGSSDAKSHDRHKKKHKKKKKHKDSHHKPTTVLNQLETGPTTPRSSSDGGQLHPSTPSGVELQVKTESKRHAHVGDNERKIAAPRP